MSSEILQSAFRKRKAKEALTDAESAALAAHLRKAHDRSVRVYFDSHEQRDRFQKMAFADRAPSFSAWLVAKAERGLDMAEGVTRADFEARPKSPAPPVARPEIRKGNGEAPGLAHVDRKQLAAIEQASASILDFRGISEDSGMRKHRLGFLVSPDHYRAVHEHEPMVRAEGLFPAPAKTPFKHKWTYAVLLVEGQVAKRYLGDAQAMARYSVTAAPCIEAAFRQAWSLDKMQPDPMHVYAYLRDQAGLAINELVISTQACIEVPAADAVVVLFWVVASRSPGQTDFKLQQR